MVTESTSPSLKELDSFNHAKILRVPNTTTLVIQATDDYIPIEEFKKVFNKVTEYAKADKINKLIFDKRKLRVFHQPSMEWYFIEWKEQVAGLGLNVHRKILPEDKIFKESVKIGREKIFRENPNIKARQMDIQYSNSLEEAIEK